MDALSERIAISIKKYREKINEEKENINFEKEMKVPAINLFMFENNLNSDSNQSSCPWFTSSSQTPIRTFRHRTKTIVSEDCEPFLKEKGIFLSQEMKKADTISFHELPTIPKTKIFSSNHFEITTKGERRSCINAFECSPFTNHKNINNILEKSLFYSLEKKNKVIQCDTPVFKEETTEEESLYLQRRQLSSLSEPNKLKKYPVKRTYSEGFWDGEADIEYPAINKNKKWYCKPVTFEKIQFADLRSESGKIMEFNCYKEKELGFSEDIQKLVKEVSVDEDMETDEELLNRHEGLVVQELLEAVCQEKSKRAILYHNNEINENVCSRKLLFSPKSK